MAAKSDPPALKRLLSPHLLDIKGVSGLGLPEGRLTVYLEADDAEVRLRVQEVVTKVAPGIRARFEVTGPFRAL